MANNYDAVDAEGYEKLMGRFAGALADAFLGFTGWPSGEEILDVGCGTGALTFALAGRGDNKRIVGVDVAEPYLRYARAHNGDPRVSFEKGDAETLPFPDASFDRAFCQHVLQFLDDPFPAVCEMRRVVRPGGMVAACLWDGYGGQPHLRMLWDTAAALGFDKDRTLFRPPLDGEGQMEAMWRRAGLVDVAQGEIMMRFKFSNFEDYWTPFLSGDAPAGQLVANLEPAQRDALARQVRHQFLSGRPDGPRSFVGVSFICKGTVPR
jgi:SAM-dependent methyltransferase